MKIKIWLAIIPISLLYITLSNLVFWQSISDISTKFCNDWMLLEDLIFSTNSAKLNEICTQFTNNTNQDISIKIGFPDGAITNDEYKKQACRWEWNIENFWKYVIQKNKILTIPAQQSIIEKNHIRFPAWFSWIVHGCQTIFLDETSTDKTNLVNIVTRKTSYIDILVWWNFKREINTQFFNRVNNLGTNKKINTSFNLDSSLSLKLNFINSWDIDEFIQWSWTISNNFWFSKEFTIQQTKISSNSTEILNINIGNLPFYWWFYKIQINWKIEPKIDFNKNSLDSRLKESININEETTITVIPWNIVIWIIILIIMIFTVKQIKKRRNNLDQPIQI